jgi:hypothetical protein
MKLFIQLILVLPFIQACSTGGSSSSVHSQLKKSKSIRREVAADVAAEASQQKRAFILVVLDGVGYEQLRTLDKNFLLQEKIRSVVPPKNAMTFPGHATIATGSEIDDSGEKRGHGIERNKKIPGLNMAVTFKPYSADDLKVQPMWAELASRGFQVRTHQWPLSNRPWRGIHHHADKVYPPYNPKLRLPDAAQVIFQELKSWDRQRDLFIMASTPGLDDVGHTYGPLAPEVHQEWAKVKFELEEFKASLAEMPNNENVYVLFVSDHGMSTMEKCPWNCALYTRPTRKGQPKDRGFHGGDPAKNNDLDGVIWGYPFNPSELDQKIESLADVKSFVWAYFGL